MKYAYSYLRWSTKLQGKELRDSRTRQQNSASLWLRKHPEYTPGETFIDPGKSSFKEGKHIGTDDYGKARGELERFLRLVETGEVAKGSLLLIDSYDRFSRLKPSKALALFMRVIDSGIGLVFTGSYRQDIIDENAINNDPNLLQFVVGEMIRAYSESAEKSRKIKSAKQRKLAELKAGLIVPHNNVPKYVTYDKSTKTYVHNDNTQYVQRMVRDFLAGNSLYSIAKRFNDEGVKTFRRGFQWSAKSCKVILQNRILLGEFLGNKKFCTPIVEPEDFEKVQAMLAKNEWILPGRDGQNLVNIFRGLAYCSACGKRMHFNHQTVTLSTGKKRYYRYIRCPSHSTGQKCTNRQYMFASDVEDELFVEYLMKTPEGLTQVNSEEANRVKRAINSKRIEKGSVEKEIERLMTAAHLKIPQFLKRAEKLKNEADKLQRDIDTLSDQLRRVQGAPVDFGDLQKIVGVWNRKTLYKDEVDEYNRAVFKVQQMLQNNEIRKRIRPLLPSFIGRIKCFTQVGSRGAFEVLDHRGETAYRSLGFDS